MAKPSAPVTPVTPGTPAAAATTPAPAAKKSSDKSLKIRLEHDLRIDNTGGTFKIMVECLVSKDGVAVPDQEIVVKDKITTVHKGRTNSQGLLLYTLNGALSDKEQDKKLRFCLSGFSEEESLEQQIPAKVKKAVEDKDPETLVLSRYHQGGGRFKIHARVLRHQGSGVETNVNIWYRGKNEVVKTDKDGIAVYEVPGSVAAGKSFYLQAAVSGIADPARININRPSKPRHNAKRFSKAWWRSNNGRAFLLLSVTTAVWLVCLLIGPGQSLINDMTFRKESSGLSKQEELYRSIIIPASSQAKANQVVPIYQYKDEWNHDLWKLALILTLLTALYYPLSMREEIMEGLAEGLEALLDSPYAKAGDPTFEKLVKWIGTYSVARRPAIAAAAADSTEHHGHDSDGAHPGLGTLFTLDLLSDVLVHVFPSVMKKVF